MLNDFLFFIIIIFLILYKNFFQLQNYSCILIFNKLYDLSIKIATYDLMKMSLFNIYSL